MISYIVALTGGIGSGKSTVANIFYKFGVPLIDSDIIARKLVKKNQPALYSIVKYFGSAILNKDGSLNRVALKNRIFKNKNEKKWLNNLLHPLIEQKTKKQLSFFSSSSYILWVVPLLIENNLQYFADRILVVDVEQNIQIVRTMNRDKISRKEVKNIIVSQVTRNQRLSFADDIINNNTDQVNKKYIAILHQHYLTLSIQKAYNNNVI